MAATETRTESLGERVSRLEGGYEHVATKADLGKLERRIDQVDARIDKLDARMEAGFAQMEERMDSRFQQMQERMQTQFAQMQALVAQQENRLMLRFGGMMVAVVGVIVAAIRFLG